jgi:hypothetical protein
MQFSSLSWLCLSSLLDAERRKKKHIVESCVDNFMSQDGEGILSHLFLHHWLAQYDHIKLQNIRKHSLAACPGQRCNSFGGQLAVSVKEIK